MALRTAASPTLAPARPGFWDGALGYSQSVLVCAMALALGGFFHWRVGYGITPSPAGLAGSAAFGTLLLAFLARRFREDRLVMWICGIPFAIASTATLVLLSVVGGVVPQTWLQERLGVPSAFGSWPFLFVAVLVEVNLIGSAVRRCHPLTWTNAQYLLTHGGLALALFGGAFGATSLERNRMVLFHGTPSHEVYDEHGHTRPVPFTATLREFTLERFPPTLVLARQDAKARDGVDIDPGSEFVRPGMKERLGDYRLEVLEFLPQAAFSGERYLEYRSKTSAPAAKVRVTGPDGKTLGEGWVTSGSVEVPDAMLAIDEKTAIAMPEPRPRKFRSEVEIRREGRTTTAQIEVNKPLSFGDTTLYQLSYDEKMGAASEYSVIEVVRDRSIPLVYGGMLAMLAGVAMMMWTGVGAPARRLKK